MIKWPLQPCRLWLQIGLLCSVLLGNACKQKARDAPVSFPQVGCHTNKLLYLYFSAVTTSFPECLYIPASLESWDQD